MPDSPSALHATSERCQRCHERIKGRPVGVQVHWRGGMGVGVEICHDCGQELEAWLETAPLEAKR